MAETGNSEARNPYNPNLRRTMYQRMKLYDKLMTSNNNLDLKVPNHIVNPLEFVPFSNTTQKSWMTVFSIWNTMIGSTVLAIPWGIDQAGLVMGSIVIVIVGFIACYTCHLIAKYSEAAGEENIMELIGRMWGDKGRYLTLVMSCLVLLGALMAFNVLLNSAFFNILEGLSIWISGSKFSDCSDCWDTFSSRYTPFILFGVLLVFLNFKDKRTYIKLNSGGIFFVLIITFFIIAVGIRALAINTFTTSGSNSIPDSDKKCSDNWNCLKHDRDVHLSLIEPGCLSFAGILSLSFFIHNCIAIILKNNEKQEKNTRDLVLGYFAVGLSYFLIGILGYLGFKGNGFPQGSIKQNALDMFSADNVLAFIIRFVLFTQMMTVYPMVAYLVRAQLLGFFFNSDSPNRKIVFMYSLGVASITTLIASVYPKVGSIAGVAGAICGLYFIYVIPVVLHAEYTKPEMVRRVLESPGGMRMAEKEEDMLNSVQQSPRARSKWKFSVGVHCLICVFGLAVVVFQFVKV